MTSPRRCCARGRYRVGPGLRPADLDGLRGAKLRLRERSGSPPMMRWRPTVAGQRRTWTGFPHPGTYEVVSQCGALGWDHAEARFVKGVRVNGLDMAV